MKRRFVAALIVVLAVLFSQGGGHVLAAICPHLRAAAQEPEKSCHTNAQDVVAEHHHGSVATRVDTTRDAFETKESDVRCNHCVVHSQSNREEPSLQQTNTTQRTGDSKVTTTTFTPAGPSLLEAVKPVAKAHGPPGFTAPLYLLVNVFRI